MGDVGRNSFDDVQLTNVVPEDYAVLMYPQSKVCGSHGADRCTLTIDCARMYARGKSSDFERGDEPKGTSRAIYIRFSVISS